MVAPKSLAKHEPLFNKSASEATPTAASGVTKLITTFALNWVTLCGAALDQPRCRAN